MGGDPAEQEQPVEADAEVDPTTGEVLVEKEITQPSPYDHDEESVPQDVDDEGDEA